MIGDVDLTGLEHLVVAVDSPIVATGAAVFSPDMVYRYALTRQWAAGPAAVFVMLNPSTADAFRSDPTITRCRNFAVGWGCGGLLVLNAFALRSTDPALLRVAPDPVGPDNDLVISRILSQVQVGEVIVAWGADRVLRAGRAAQLMALLRRHRMDPHCLGRTRGGYPRHPLYVRSDTRPSPYREPTS